MEMEKCQLRVSSNQNVSGNFHKGAYLSSKLRTEFIFTLLDIKFFAFVKKQNFTK